MYIYTVHITLQLGGPSLGSVLVVERHASALSGTVNRVAPPVGDLQQKVRLGPHMALICPRGPSMA